MTKIKERKLVKEWLTSIDCEKYYDNFIAESWNELKLIKMMPASVIKKLMKTSGDVYRIKSNIPKIDEYIGNQKTSKYQIKTKPSDIIELRKPYTSWVLFCNTNRKSNPDVKNIFAKASEMWKNMNNINKNIWIEKAKQEKLQYQQFKTELKKHSDYTKIPTEWIAIKKKKKTTKPKKQQTTKPKKQQTTKPKKKPKKKQKKETSKEIELSTYTLGQISPTNIELSSSSSETYSEFFKLDF
jgi:hypothetical protein